VIAMTFLSSNGLGFTGMELPVVETILDLGQGH